MIPRMPGRGGREEQCLVKAKDSSNPGSATFWLWDQDKLFQFTEPQFLHLEGAAVERILPQCLLPAVMLVPITSTCCLLNVVTNQYDVGVMGAGLGAPSH